MTTKETLRQLKMLRKPCEFNNWDGCYIYLELMDGAIENLEVLDLYKKFFKYSLTEIQGIKYLTLPNSDIRRPDSMLKITDEEYELLKEGLENDK